MVKIQNLDQEALIFLNQLGCREYDDIWLYITNAYTWIPVYFLILIILFQQYKFLKTALILALIGLMLFFTDFVTSQLIRPFFERLRPCHVEEIAQHLRQVKEGCGGKYGFFSAHAASSFGFATLLGRILYPNYKYAIYLLFVWAIAVTYSRLYLGVHYPTDVIFGALYGVIVSHFIFKIYKRVDKFI